MSHDGFTATGAVPEGRGNVSRQKEVIHRGTPNEQEIVTGGHRVQGDGRNYVGSSWSPFGVDGADEERCKKEGAAPPLKWSEKLKIAADRLNRRVADERKKRDGMTTEQAAAQAREVSAGDRLKIALEACGDDRELQLRVFDKWMADQKKAEDKRAPADVPAPPVPTPAPAPAADKKAVKAA